LPRSAGAPLYSWRESGRVLPPVRHRRNPGTCALDSGAAGALLRQRHQRSLDGFPLGDLGGFEGIAPARADRQHTRGLSRPVCPARLLVLSPPTLGPTTSALALPAAARQAAAWQTAAPRRRTAWQASRYQRGQARRAAGRKLALPQEERLQDLGNAVDRRAVSQDGFGRHRFGRIAGYTRCWRVRARLRGKLVVWNWHAPKYTGPKSSTRSTSKSTPLSPIPK
jgi:hypothetical protein